VVIQWSFKKVLTAAKMTVPSDLLQVLQLWQGAAIYSCVADSGSPLIANLCSASCDS